MTRLRRGLLACLLLAWFWLAGAAELVPLPPLQQRVTDLTGTLAPGQQAELVSRLQALETTKGAQLAILLLPSTQPEAIEQFGIRLAEVWKLGRKGVDDGAIIIVAKNDRRMRIEVGYGLEGAIPDAVAKRIISEQMAPRFKQGDYFGGLSAAVDQLAQRMDAGAPAGVATTETPSSVEEWWQDPFSLIFAAIFGAGILHALLGIMGYVVVAGIAGVIAFLATASWLVALGVALAVFFLSLIGLGSGRSRGGGSGNAGGWDTGSSFGGSSSDSGFSGGGGDFGGGGASGDW